MGEPEIAQEQSIAVEVIPGRGYRWCRSGWSGEQPRCVSAHKGTGFSPIMSDPDAAQTIRFCCEQSGDKPFCDGTHNTL